MLHFLVPVRFLILSVFYSRVLKDFLNRNIILAVVLLFLVFSLINSTLIQKIGTFNSYALTLEGVWLCILSLSSYIFLVHESVSELRARTVGGLNWLSSGLFLYYSSTLLIFYSGNIITKKFSLSASLYTWAIHSFFSVLMYICFFIGFWKGKS